LINLFRIMSQKRPAILVIGLSCLDFRPNQNNMYVSGPLNEDSSFPSTTSDSAKPLHLHLDEVSSINSTGIRQWLIWVNSQPEATWKLWGCPSHFINQLNIIDGFVPAKTRVRSLYIPYFSDETEEEAIVLIDREAWEKDKTTLKAPNGTAGRPMEPDIIEQRYFKFTTKY